MFWFLLLFITLEHNIALGDVLFNLGPSTPVEIEQYPFQASVFVNDVFAGSGVIINPKLVLANTNYLFAIFPYDIYLRVGDKNRNLGEKYEVKNFYSHPDYFYTPDHDVSIIEISGRFKFNKSVQPANLTLVSPPSNTVGTVVGWGSAIGRNTTDLHAAKMYVMDPTTCNSTALGEVTERIICVSHPDIYPCEDDLGDPFLVEDKLVGIFAGGFSSCRPENVLFTKIPAYKEYLDTRIDMIRNPENYGPGSAMEMGE